MNRHVVRLALRAIALASMLCAFSAAGQESSADSASEETTPESESTSQETDINEDNYRRFMELRDQSRQRPSAPYAVLAPPSNLEKMSQLPEESQKHLRNQLLGIILEGGRWTPEDADKGYPFTPSAAASNDARLRNMEAEAWSELIQNYHARESEIYQAGERARSASVPGGPGSEDTAQGEERAAESRKQANGTPQSQRPGRPGAPGSTANAEMPRDAGMTVNVLDHLTGGTPPVSPSAESASPGMTTTRQPDGSAASATTSESASGQPASAQGQSNNPARSQANASETARAENDGEASKSQPAEQSPSNSTADSSAASSSTATEPSTAAQTAQSASASTSENQSESEARPDPAQPEVDYGSEGVIAIRDLKKVKGTASGAPGKKEDEEEEP